MVSVHQDWVIMAVSSAYSASSVGRMRHIRNIESKQGGR